MFPVAVLRYLEDATTQRSMALGKRLVAGKLRLCIQASLRWDDLARTPVQALEWVRQRGESAIRGLDMPHRRRALDRG